MFASARSERGQALVEVALILPIFFYVVFAIIDFGIAFGRYVELTNAAREAARYASIFPLNLDSTCTGAADPNNIKYAVKSNAIGVTGISNGSVTISYESPATNPPTVYAASSCGTNSQYAASPNYIRVSIAYSYVPFTPFLNVLFPSGALTISASSAIAIE